MPDWNHIPPEIKQLVVKKLDFMGRLAMKSVSHTDRCIVNSTVFNLPRVRFGYKNDKCLIVIYQGIENFLRLEFVKGAKGVTVIRSENTWDPKDTSSKMLKSSDPLASGLSILKTFFAHKSMSIEVLEWDVHVEIYNNLPLRNRIVGFFSDAKLQVKQIASPSRSVGMLKDLANEICVSEKVNTFRGYGYLVSDKNLVPIMAVETYEEDGKHNYFTHYKMEQLTRRTFIENMESLPTILYATQYDTRQAMVSAKFFKLSELANHDVRDHDQSFELFIKRTECGAWFNAMKTESLERFAFVKNQKCGLGNDCKNCSDPFEYWYYQNLPRRILHEPDWDNWIEAVEHENTVDHLRGLYRADEKKKSQILKGKKNQKAKSKIPPKRILIKSAHFESLHINKPTLRNLSPEKIIRIMREYPTFSTKLGGFLIPNSKDYFRLYMGDENKEYVGDDGRSNFGIERIAVEEDSVDSEVENDYPNASAINKFILKAALRKEPVLESYKEWDENEKNPKIEFLDFEWRFYEFYHGKRDLSIERRPESSLTFNDLTSEVLEKIVEKTDMFDRLVIRKVCRNLRETVDKTNANCKEVLLRFGLNHMIFGWKKEYIKYIQAKDEDEFKFEVHRFIRYGKKEIKEVTFSKKEFARMMIADAANFLKTPNLKIGKFGIHTIDNDCQHLFPVVVRFMKSLNFKIPASELNLPYSIPFHEILPFFDSTSLKKLWLNDKFESQRKSKKNTVSNEEDEAQNELEKVMKMEIWTKIESVKIDFRLSDGFPIQKLFHFKEIDIRAMKLTEKRLVKIRDILLKTPHFERACFPLDEMKMPMKKAKNRRRRTENPWKSIDGIMSRDAAYDSGTRRFSIPGSEEYYQLKLGWGQTLVIRRTLKENQNSDDSD